MNLDIEKSGIVKDEVGQLYLGENLSGLCKCYQQWEATCPGSNSGAWAKGKMTSENIRAPGVLQLAAVFLLYLIHVELGVSL